MRHGREPASGVREVFGGHHICGACSLRLFLEINEAGTSFLETHRKVLMSQYQCYPTWCFLIGRHATLKKGGSSYNLIK